MFRRFKNLWRLSGLDIKTDNKAPSPYSKHVWLQENKTNLATIVDFHKPENPLEEKLN